MSQPLLVVRTAADLRAALASRRAGGVALVPTMGALHDGHLALVARARREAACVAATIFVNPTQFAAGEDFSAYPRTEDTDLAKLEAAGADIVFAPAPRDVYPPGFATTVHPQGPAVAGLEDRVRPDHFAGVATVVTKLFLMSGADIAVFGEKDYQQLCVVRQLARDLDIPIRIVGVETVREADGLAMSSRNRYLSPEDRARAPGLQRALRKAADALRRGTPVEPTLATARAALEDEGFALDYFEARHAETLAPHTEGPQRLLAAARLGRTRLLDNVPV